MAKYMDGFLALLGTTDSRTKLAVAMDLIDYLGDPNNPIECSNIGRIIGGIVAWVQSSNTKVGAFSHSFEWHMFHSVVIHQSIFTVSQLETLSGTAATFRYMRFGILMTLKMSFPFGS